MPPRPGAPHLLFLVKALLLFVDLPLTGNEVDFVRWNEGAAVVDFVRPVEDDERRESDVRGDESIFRKGNEGIEACSAQNETDHLSMRQERRTFEESDDGGCNEGEPGPPRLERRFIGQVVTRHALRFQRLHEADVREANTHPSYCAECRHQVDEPGEHCRHWVSTQCGDRPRITHLSHY